MQRDYSDVLEYKRINVVGTSGSGKTTVSQSLSQILKIEHIEMDALFWGPNWSWPNDEEFFTKLEHALVKEAWILDGNYTRTIPLKWKHVEVVIWLDYSFMRTVLHAVRRAITRSITQEELWEGTGNRESFTKSFFSKDSIILWTISTHKKVRQKYERFMNDVEYSEITFIRLRDPKETQDFLAYLKQQTYTGRER
jgi:adenylate kinase family enzyme